MWWLKYAHHFLSLSTEQRTTERVQALEEELRTNNSDFGERHPSQEQRAHSQAHCELSSVHTL